MAEQAYWWTTSGTPTGDQVSSYTQADLAVIGRVLAACSGFEGVAPGYQNELACTDGGANTVDVASGGAVVDGKPYNNTATINVNVPSAVGGGNTRIDRIVVRVTWASFTGEVHRIAGTDAASPTAPAITQTSGTTYDIQLCQALVDTSGNITVTDERTWARGPAITDRQGGNATDWADYGTTDYLPSPADYLEQVGVINVDGGAGISAGGADSVSVTFPQAFSDRPLVTGGVMVNTAPGGEYSAVAALSALSTSGFTVFVTNESSTLILNVDFHWRAIGPM